MLTPWWRSTQLKSRVKEKRLDTLIGPNQLSFFFFFFNRYTWRFYLSPKKKKKKDKLWFDLIFFFLFLSFKNFSQVTSNGPTNHDIESQCVCNINSQPPNSQQWRGIEAQETEPLSSSAPSSLLLPCVLSSLSLLLYLLFPLTYPMTILTLDTRK